jgi:hypothetical protein
MGVAKYGGPGTNNGRLIFSCRMAAEALGISKDKASDCFKKLTGCGFIMPMEKGGFNRKGNSARQATTWLITEFASDVTGKLATKDFMRWSPDQGAVSASEKNRVRRADPLVGHADPPVRHTDRQGIKPYQRSATRTEIAGNSPSPVRQTDTASLPGGHAPPASASEPAAAAPQPVMVSPPPPPPGNPERGRMEVEAFPSVPQPASTAADRRARNPWPGQMDLFAAPLPPPPPDTPRDRCLRDVAQWRADDASATVDRWIAGVGVEEVERLIGEANSIASRRNYARRLAWTDSAVRKLASRAEIARVASSANDAAAVIVGMRSAIVGRLVHWGVDPQAAGSLTGRLLAALGGGQRAFDYVELVVRRRLSGTKRPPRSPICRRRSSARLPGFVAPVAPRRTCR